MFLNLIFNIEILPYSKDKILINKNFTSIGSQIFNEYKGYIMILEIFKDSLEYSFKKPKTILKIGFLVFLSLFIVPQFLVNGYSYRITRIGVNGMINGNDPLPEFERWGKMFLEGVKIFIVRFIYLIPGTMIFLIFSSGIYSLTKFPGYGVLLIELGVIAISIILWLIFYLLSIVAIPNMIYNKGSLKSAFKIKEILYIIKSIGVLKYIKFYTGCIVLILGILAAVYLLIALIGLISGLTLSAIIGPAGLGFSGVVIASISIIVLIFIIAPFFMIFESRGIALMYNTREN